MTDIRKFCWGTLIGMGAVSALDNHGIASVTDTGVIALGLSLGCLIIIWFGKREERP